MCNGVVMVCDGFGDIVVVCDECGGAYEGSGFKANWYKETRIDPECYDLVCSTVCKASLEDRSYA